MKVEGKYHIWHTLTYLICILKVHHLKYKVSIPYKLQTYLIAIIF